MYRVLKLSVQYSLVQKKKSEIFMENLKLWKNEKNLRIKLE